jgi:hypothetical protein
MENGVMGGYEIQNLSYKTFEGVEAEAINSITEETTAKWVSLYKEILIKVKYQV